MIKVLELFGGIGACTKALERLGIEHEVADYVEIDKYAVKSFNAIHGTNFEPQDICTWDKDIKVDLIMHGSPCQDFSVAGRQAGGDEGSGTRSSLMYETLRIVEKLKPKYVIWENVKNLLSPKHRHNFEAYQEAMRDLGYTNYYQVLNAKNYGVPQNRERVFTVSILGDEDFKFPESEPLKKRLKDVLETDVDEKYYIKEATSLPVSKEVSKTIRTGGRGSLDKHTWDLVAEPKVVASRGRYGEDGAIRQHLEPRNDGLTNTLTSVQKDNLVAKLQDGVMPTLTVSGREQKVAEMNIIEDFYKNRPEREYSETAPTLRSERIGLKVKTLTTSDNQGTLDGYRIRKLTPKECWRLMGFDDADFEKAEKVNSNTQLYKQAGNSIVVNVLEGILRNLLKEER